MSVVVITYNRPGHVADCVAHLLAQNDPAEQVIVVDASPDDRTQNALAGFADAIIYIRNPGGVRNMTNSRNVALDRTTGDVIAFLDDDAFAAPDYLSALRRAYADPSVGLACCRTLNGQPGEDTDGVDRIGRFSESNGVLTGFFAADPGRDIEIEHGIGATMSFRRSTVSDLGGFREDYTGISGVREDADAFLRARKLGYRAIFIHEAVASHVAAPQAKGKRFDRRYQFASARNHAILLSNNFGLRPLLILRYLYAICLDALRQPTRNVVTRLGRLAIALAGTASGLTIGTIRHGPKARDPRRNDPAAVALRRLLAT